MCLFTCPDNASLKCKNTITDGGGTAPQWYHQQYCHHQPHWKRAQLLKKSHSLAIFRWVWPLLEQLPFPICPNGLPCRLDLRWWWPSFWSIFEQFDHCLCVLKLGPRPFYRFPLYLHCHWPKCLSSTIPMTSLQEGEITALLCGLIWFGNRGKVQI